MFDRISLIIGAEHRDASVTGQSENLINPATEQVLGQVPHARESDLEDVVNAAQSGLDLWRNSSLKQRHDVMLAAADIIEENLGEYAKIMTQEQGKPVIEAEGEWLRVVETLRWNGDAATKLKSTTYPPRSEDLVQYSQPEPVGICLALTAWNFPAILPVRKIAPALAAGCSVILKAAEETPASAQLLVEALIKAGLPDGVVNLVFGDPAFISSTLIENPKIRKITFTGSVPIGKRLAQQASEGLKRCTFELGGHAPAIVFEDADVETAAKTLAGFKFRNAGQVCIAPSRFFVHDNVYDEFQKKFIEQAKKIVIGDGMNSGVTMGPMANPRRIKAMHYLLDDAIGKGANVAYIAPELPEQGYYVSPTVLEDVSADSRIMLEEPFGPIAPLVKFSDQNEVIEKANALQYGLACYLFTGSGERAKQLAAELEAGSVAINTVSPAQPETPFGGVKESGYGYEGGLEGIDAFLVKKLISAPMNFLDND